MFENEGTVATEQWMKTAICYYSRHHGNTLKVLEAMAEEGEVDLIDVTTRQLVRLEEYDCVGFASGIYGFEFQKAVVEFARQYLPQGKPVFFVYTYGGLRGTGCKHAVAAAREKDCILLVVERPRRETGMELEGLKKLLEREGNT